MAHPKTYKRTGGESIGVLSPRERWVQKPYPAYLSGPVRKLSPEEIAAYEKQLASRGKMGK